MTYEIEVEAVFSAAHALRLPDGSLEPMHGHDWQVTACLGADGLDAMETVADFHPVHDALSRVLSPWRNRCLNECEPFAGESPGELEINPSAERVAQAIAQGLSRELGGGSPAVLWVRVTEAAGCAAVYRPGG
ncbi:MAG: 6-carboxytetrahydropterin synthase [Planctomycetota bacterium]